MHSTVTHKCIFILYAKPGPQGGGGGHWRRGGFREGAMGGGGGWEGRLGG